MCLQSAKSDGAVAKIPAETRSVDLLAMDFRLVMLDCAWHSGAYTGSSCYWVLLAVFGVVIATGRITTAIGRIALPALLMEDSAGRPQ